MTRLLVATTNAGKLAEFVPVLSGHGLQVVTLGDLDPLPEAVEDGATFAANAALKADHYGALTGLAVLADDSGLEVAALGGQPGVRSARYAGADADMDSNLALLRERMAGQDDRRAAFVCALCLREPDGRRLEVDGRCTGTLTASPAGEGGFGYDPLFVPDGGDGRTFAEMTRDEKRALSHRGRALAALAAALERREART